MWMLFWNVPSTGTFPRTQSNRASVGRSGKTSLIHGGPTSQLTGLKGPAANVLVPDVRGQRITHCWPRQEKKNCSWNPFIAQSVQSITWKELKSQTCSKSIAEEIKIKLACVVKAVNRISFIPLMLHIHRLCLELHTLYIFKGSRCWSFLLGDVTSVVSLWNETGFPSDWNTAEQEVWFRNVLVLVLKKHSGVLGNTFCFVTLS